MFMRRLSADLLYIFMGLPEIVGNLNQKLPEVIDSCESFDTCLREMSFAIIGDMGPASSSWTSPLMLDSEFVKELDIKLNSKSRLYDSQEQIFANPLDHFVKNWNALIADSSLLADWFHHWFPNQLWWLMIMDDFRGTLDGLRGRLSLSPSKLQEHRNARIPFTNPFECSLVESFFDTFQTTNCAAVDGAKSCTSPKVLRAIHSDYLLTVGLRWTMEKSKPSSFLSKFTTLCDAYNFVIEYISSPFVARMSPKETIESLTKHSSPIDSGRIELITERCLNNRDAIADGCYKEDPEAISWLVTQEPKIWQSERTILKTTLSKIDPFFHQVVSYIDELVPTNRISYIVSHDPDFVNLFDESKVRDFLFVFGDDEFGSHNRDLLASKYDEIKRFIDQFHCVDNCSQLRLELAINSARLVPVLMQPQRYSETVAVLFGRSLSEKEFSTWKAAKWSKEEVYETVLQANSDSPQYAVQVIESNGKMSSARNPFFMALAKLVEGEELVVWENPLAHTAPSRAQVIAEPHPATVRVLPPRSDVSPSDSSSEDVWEDIPLSPPDSPVSKKIFFAAPIEAEPNTTPVSGEPSTPPCFGCLESAVGGLMTFFNNMKESFPTMRDVNFDNTLSVAEISALSNGNYT